MAWPDIILGRPLQGPPGEGREELNSSFGGSGQEAECCLAASEQPQKNAQVTEEHSRDDKEGFGDP